MVSFRNTGTTPWTPPENIPVTSSPQSSLVWNGVMNRDEFDTSVSLTFRVLAVNAHGLVSEEALATFLPSMSVLINRSLLLCVYHSPPISSFPAPPSSLAPTVSQFGSSANPSMPSSTPTISTGMNTLCVQQLCDLMHFHLTVLAIILSYSPTHAYTLTHSGLPTQSAPLVTIVAAAVCGSVVCTVVVMVAIFLFVCCCKHRKSTNDTTYRVNTPTGE